MDIDSIDNIDKKLLNIIQSEFPVEKEPYKKLAKMLDITESEVLSRIHKMMKNDIIKRLGGFFDSRKLGYTGTLCAIKVNPSQVDKVSSVINKYPGVTHNYLREHEYNMWFTLLGTGKEEINSILEEIKSLAGVKEIINLPSKRLFKIKVIFRMPEDNNA